MALPTSNLRFSDLRSAATASNSGGVFRMSQMQNYVVGAPSNTSVAIRANTFRGVERQTCDVLQFDAALRGLTNGWSTRRLSGAYTGPAVQVRRAPDNVTSNFFATAQGDLYTGSNATGTSLPEFLGGCNLGFVTTWYDQIGGVNATQAVTSNQPLITRASNLAASNYAVTFLGNGDALAFQQPVSAQSIWVQLRQGGVASTSLLTTDCNDYGFRLTSNYVYGGSNTSNDFLGLSNSVAYVDGAASAQYLSATPQAYPPGPLPGAARTLTGYAYGNGTYYVDRSTASTGTGQYAQALFNYDINTYWTAGSFGNCNMTISGCNYVAEWVDLSMPQKIALSNYTIIPRQDVLGGAPVDFIVTGTNDGVTWTGVDVQTSNVWTLAGTTFGVSNGPAYNRYRIAITRTSNIGISFAAFNMVGRQTAEATLSNATWQTMLAARGAPAMSNLLTLGAPGSNAVTTLSNASFVGQLSELLMFNTTASSAATASNILAVRSYVPFTASLSTFADMGAAFTSRLPAMTAGVPGPFALQVGAFRTQLWDYALRTGAVTLSTQADADSLFTTTKDVAPACIFVDGDLTINSGVTLRPSVRKLFTLLYVRGNLTHNGAISMSQLGANHSGTGDSAGYVAPVDLPIVPAGPSNIVVPATDGVGAAINSTNNGVAGSNAVLGGTGGGGMGGMGGVNKNARGSGATGTCFCGGPGLGGVMQNGTTVALYAGDNGGVGGVGSNLLGDTSAVGGGAGNPGGAAGPSGSAGSSGAGGTVIIMCAGTLSGSGTVTAAGAAGGAATVVNTDTLTRNLGGGGSGGGSITVLYGASSNNTLALSAAGGAGGVASGSSGANRPGGAGGAGSTRMLQMALPTLERACALFVGSLPAQASAAAASFPLMVGSLNVPFDYALRTGPVTLSVQSDADSLFTATKDTAAACIFINGDLTINSGITLRPASRKLFTLVYVAGNLAHNGVISMSQRGANHSGTGDSGGYTAPADLLITRDFKVPAAGGPGRSNSTSTLQPITAPAAGANGQSGGGGAGNMAGGGTSTYVSLGADGTCFTGGSGGGAIPGVYSGSAVVCAATPNGGAGADAVGPTAYTGGGGAGNPGGVAYSTGGSVGNAGNGGTILVLVTGALSGAGTVVSAGSSGGNANAASGGYAISGAGSGGGSITVLYKTSNASTISLSAPGGAGGTVYSANGGGYTRAGSYGGGGSTRVLPYTT